MIHTYEDFIKRVNTLGFMAFSDVLPGWTSLSGETHEAKWHTGDPETDPWRWKDRAAQEKRLAFGCILNGHKGFISAQWYPVFLRAYHPEESFEERWECGKVSQTVLKTWQLFTGGEVLSTDDIRSSLCVTKKNGAGPVDTALKILQQEYHITVSGNRRKMNAKGEPYGWPANTYERVGDWAPQKWLKIPSSLTRQQARQQILEAVLSQCEVPDIRKASKVLGL